MSNFSCNKCGNCCKWNGIVHIFKNDFEKIQEKYNFNYDELSIEKYFCFMIERFIFKNYTLNIPRLILKNIKGRCIFYDENKSCKIHDIKPMMCRTAPFNYSILNHNSVREKFRKICKPFRNLKDYKNNILGVEEEIYYEKNYLEYLEKDGVKKIFRVKYKIKWKILESKYNIAIEEYWPKNKINLLEVYNNEIK